MPKKKKAAAKTSQPTAKPVKKKAPAKRKATTKKTAAKKAPRKKATRKKASKRAPRKKLSAEQIRRNRNATAATVRSELDGLERDMPIVDLYRAGHGASEIARRLQIPRRSVQRSVQRVRQRWKEDAVETYDDAVNRAEAISFHIMGLALQGYEDSKKGNRLHRESVTEGTENCSHTKTEEHHEPATGDPRFLSLAERCNYQISQVRGLLDRDSRHNAASVDAKAALIEVVIRTPDELAELKRMEYRELEELVVSRDGVDLLQPAES